MRKNHFEAIVAVQDRHIERLERMVEELFNALHKEKPGVRLVKPEPTVVPDEEPVELPAMPNREIMPGAMFTDQ